MTAQMSVGAMPPAEIQQDEPILQQDNQFERPGKAEDSWSKSERYASERSRTDRPNALSKSQRAYRVTGMIDGREQTVSNLLNGQTIEDSHIDCDFCASQFDLLDQSQCLLVKKKMLR